MVRFLVLLGVMLLGATGQALAEKRQIDPQIYPYAPFTSNPSKLMSVPCLEQFECVTSGHSKQLLQLANKCAQGSLLYPEDFLTEFTWEEPYKGCALPQTYHPKTPQLAAKAQWPVCCIEKKGQKCRFVCHSFFTNEFNG